MGSWRWLMIFYMESSQLDFPSAVSYGIYAVNQAEIVKGSVANGQNCTFACRIPAASGCTVDDTSAVHGIQIFQQQSERNCYGEACHWTPTMRILLGEIWTAGRLPWRSVRS